jgi:hypothetical protein
MQRRAKATEMFGTVLFPYYKYGNLSTTTNLKDNTSGNLFLGLSQMKRADDFDG